MNKTPVLTACALIVGCAANAPVPDASGPRGSASASSQPSSASSPSASAASPDLLANVREVDIAPLAETTVCRRETPLGSRISVERCYVVDDRSDDATADIDRLLTREEFELMRQQQMRQHEEFERQRRQRAVNGVQRQP